MTADRDEHVYQAKLAEQAERYDEMVAAMKKVAEMNVELSVEERNLLSVAYKNVIGARRASWRIISSIEQKEGDKDDSKKLLIQDYKETIRTDICNLCDEVVTVLDGAVVPNSGTEESKVFYLKMLGDYQRYKAEVSGGADREAASGKSLEYYGLASEACAQYLDPCNPIRLGLALNQSVFFYEIMGKIDKACELAKDAIRSAYEAMQSDVTREDTRKDATLIMQLLRDNLKLWQDGQYYGEGEGEDDTQLQDVEDDD